jgi:protein SCO1/2
VLAIKVTGKTKLSHLNTTNLKQIILSSVLFLLAASVAHASDSLPYFNSPEFTPHWLESKSPTLEDFHRIPSFNFTDQDGQEVTEKTFENKIYVAGFFFSTCPGICPSIRTKLNKAQEKFLKDTDVKILQHSIRPNTDKVDTLENTLILMA